MACLKPLNTLTTRRECALKLLEEASEACEAMKELERYIERPHSEAMESFKRQVTLMELADVLQVVANCLHAMGVTPDELDEAVCKVQMHNVERGRHAVECAKALTVDWGKNG